MSTGRAEPRRSTDDLLDVSDEVGEALAAGRAVVALESSLVAQGLPAPHNLETARAAEAAVRGIGATPATVAIDAGRLVVGASDQLLERLARAGPQIAKGASRDLGPLLAGGRLASTTVSGTVRAAHWVGIEVMATGGIGGVHRGEGPLDVSSDIEELSVTPMAVICSGVKSILDLPATFELLETRRIPVIGLAVEELPSFYTARSGIRLEHAVGDARAAAAVIAAHRAVPGSGAILIVQPPPAEVAIDGEQIDDWVTRATREARSSGVTGGAVTPQVLARLVELSKGLTLKANIGLIVNNAAAAAEIALALADMRTGRSMERSRAHRRRG